MNFKKNAAGHVLVVGMYSKMESFIPSFFVLATQPSENT